MSSRLTSAQNENVQDFDFNTKLQQLNFTNFSLLLAIIIIRVCICLKGDFNQTRSYGINSQCVFFGMSKHFLGKNKLPGHFICVIEFALHFESALPHVAR